MFIQSFLHKMSASQTSIDHNSLIHLDMAAWAPDSWYKMRSDLQPPVKDCILSPDWDYTDSSHIQILPLFDSIAI